MNVKKLHIIIRLAYVYMPHYHSLKENNMQKENYQKLIEQKLQSLPLYVYYYAQQPNLAVTTIYQYLSEYERFFTWLRTTQTISANDDNKLICTATSNKDISIDTLKNLQASQVQQYLIDCQSTENKQNKITSKITINRTIHALRSLFHYLTVVADLNNGEPYFYRNVMLKIPFYKGVKESISYRNVKYGPQLYMGEKKFEWIHFIENDYEKTLSKHAIRYFKFNKERDIAIIALLLASGLRISELVNLNIHDLNIIDRSVLVIRKGGKKDAALIADWAIPYLKKYLHVRNTRYQPNKQLKAIFITRYRETAKRIDTSTIQRFVEKYSVAFPDGSRTTPHKLRHSLGTEIYNKSMDVVAVATQLGHTGLSATDQYIQQANKEKQRMILNQK